MTELYYVYGLEDKESEVLAILYDHKLSAKALDCLHGGGFEFELRLNLPNNEFNAAVVEINNIKSCWVQPTRKGLFIDPEKLYLKRYAAGACTLVETSKKIIYNARLSCDNQYGVYISTHSDCSSYKHLFSISGFTPTSEFEIIDLNTIYFSLPSNPADLIIEGVVT